MSADCSHRVVFEASSLAKAVRMAQEELHQEPYEYGYIFKSL